jgi:hypothetical protein
MHALTLIDNSLLLGVYFLTVKAPLRFQWKIVQN